MADTDDLSPADIEARMSAGLKRALATPTTGKAKRAEAKRRPAKLDQPSA